MHRPYKNPVWITVEGQEEASALKNKQTKNQKLSIVDEQYPKVLSVRSSNKHLIQEPRDTFGPLVDPSTVHQNLIRRRRRSCACTCTKYSTKQQGHEK